MRYTKEQNSDLIRLRMSGVPIAELASLYGRTKGAMRRKLERLHAVTYHHWTPEEDAVLRAALNQVARKTGRTLSAVAGRAKRIT